VPILDRHRAFAAEWDVATKTPEPVDFAAAARNIGSMLSRNLTVCVLITWLYALSGIVIAEQPDSTGIGSVPPSLQQQLDELRAGQAQLRQELDEIKALLQERAGRTNTSTRSGPPNIVSANVHGEPFRGTNTARVAIIEYSDFDCSFCGRYARAVFPQIDQEYVQTGKVKYFFRDLPEPNETNSWFKARAARCAGDQGKFWELHDLLFSQQSTKAADVVALAPTVGLNMDQFNECLTAEKYLVNIQRSAAGAKRMGLYGTPAFLIGSITEEGDFIRVKKVLIGAQSFETLKEVLDELLSANARRESAERSKTRW